MKHCMIDYIQIENFKSLKSVYVPLSGLNLFLGMNGMGKSSVIQSLLLIRQSFWRTNQQSMDRLYLNGDLVALGTQKDIFCQTMDKSGISFIVGFSNSNEYKYIIPYVIDGSLDDILKLRTIRHGQYSESLFDSSHFTYLSAEHIAPKKEYSSVNYQERGLNPLGNRGEYAVSFLARNGRSYKVPAILQNPDAVSDQLIDQVSAWLGTISPGVKVIAEDLPQQQKSKLSMQYAGNQLNTEDISPINTGFGVSYVLPLIIALLTSGQNSLLLIENPESHLHPKGQVYMARLMALAVSNGAQIICESHSDHIINGVRVSVHDGIIHGDDTYVGFFSKNNNQETLITDINIDNSGNLDHYPDGLLDEWGNQMAKLF